MEICATKVQGYMAHWAWKEYEKLRCLQRSHFLIGGGPFQPSFDFLDHQITTVLRTRNVVFKAIEA